ncbi:hypothetical protein CLU88_1923 [Acidovorax sp. 56]|nr:hypothetical protein CLU88_1923 [Acidovorax sp. 56]
MQHPFSPARTAPHSGPWNKRLWLAVTTGAIGLCILVSPSYALTKGSAGDKTTANNTTISKKNTGKVTHQRSPSEESRAERDRRLYRECKGMPNAGACLGYTRR